MSRNIEIKARIESIEALATKVAALADEGPVELTQEDTFFRCDAGRLKLRAFSDLRGELIFYARANQAGPKESLYIISKTGEPGSLRDTLSLAYGQIGHVKKRRTLYLIGKTRVHLDMVEGLGNFMELEVVLMEGEEAQLGVEVALNLMAQLGIRSEQLVEGAYVDLIAEQGA
jgi:predicted adenylyl cyclase CyaB